MRRGEAFIDSFVDMADLVIENGPHGWHFEWSDIFGPAVVSAKTGDPLERQPGERSGVWRAVSIWARQGKRVEPHAGRLRAVWDEPPAATYTMRGKLIIGQHEPEGFDPDYSVINYVQEGATA